MQGTLNLPPRAQSGIPEFEGHTERLLDCLMVTMTQNPEQVLRNAATHAFNSLLAALQVWSPQ